MKRCNNSTEAVQAYEEMFPEYFTNQLAEEFKAFAAYHNIQYITVLGPGEIEEEEEFGLALVQNEWKMIHICCRYGEYRFTIDE